MLPDAIYTGWVRHRRFRPRPHHFRYPLAMVQLDLDRLSEHFAQSRWWSLERFNLIGFRRSDYLDAPGDNLDQAVRNYVAAETGKRPVGPVQIYTQPRIWGLAFNPVTFYWCYDADGNLETIVTEVNNTPWNERYAYVLPVANSNSGRRDTLRFEFDKKFHVSPFMPMALQYRWQFSFKESQTTIHMTLFDGENRHFDATFLADAKPLTKKAMRRLPWRYPAQCLRVLAAIYWQAFRLWLKGIPFYTHPESGTSKTKEQNQPIGRDS